MRAKLLLPEFKTARPGALGAAKARDKRKVK